jgi:nucleotide-binding universal stress UspA family protein
MKTIVLGYDETDAASRALERAADFAEAFKARLVVTSVAPVLAAAGRGMGAIDPTDPVERHLEELAHAREYLSGRGLQAEFRPGVGEPADTIVAVAEEVGADLIVVGTREPNFLERLLGQSVSQSVSRQAHCDVLIVH